MSAWMDKIKQLDLKQADRIAPVALAIAILILCWKLAALLWLLLAPPQVMQIERVELGSQQAQVPNISSFALFQEAANTSAADQQLNMSLQGVVQGYPSQFSSAVIKVNEVADRYRVGEMILGSNYSLSEVYWDRVILRNNSGAVRELKFKGMENGLDQPIVPELNPNASNSNTGASAPANTQNTQPSSAIGQAVQQIQENRDQYLQDMGIGSSANGSGYEVTARTPVGLRNKLGLQPGDRIMSLNGQTVGQGQTEAQLLEQARREGQVKLEIKRGDQVVTVQQDLK
ncbi:general secretion pathway protein [Acinetobacter cumulans]|uniref:General secretion pathway protein n=1 Tax=Acinetobacter cumulans TaxID=2136182 RepID=A0A3A8FNJ8_9GAMM|nr:type II secretion system protein N [Acinetobacter cumulans]RKG47799.1 general secretion pathway protein [Acinetobacter cumulans]